jgi:undecaprenyl-diphosphatase
MDITAIQHWLLANPGWVIASIGAVSFVESFALLGIIVPGIIILGAASFAAGAVDLSLPGCLIAAFAGAVSGDGVSYLLGRIFHADIKRAWPFRKHPIWIANGEAFFDRHGAWGVALGRFVGPIRPVIPLVAGILSMPARRFFLINVVSGTAWSPLYVLPGYMLGAAVESKGGSPALLVGAAVGIIGSSVALFVLRQRSKRN